MLRDVTLLWALRSSCAFGCPHCYFGTIEEHKDNPPGQAGALSHLSRTDLPANALTAFARTLAGSPVERVVIAGGEPLDWPGALEVISLIKDAGSQVVIATNGVPLTRPHVAERLVALGADGVSVSLDSADAETNDQMRPSRSGRFGYRDVLEGIHTLLQARAGRSAPRVGIYTVVTRSRPQEITDVAQLAAASARTTTCRSRSPSRPTTRSSTSCPTPPATSATSASASPASTATPRGWPCPTRRTSSASSPRSPPTTTGMCPSASAALACSSSSPAARSGTARPIAGSPPPRPSDDAPSETARAHPVRHEAGVHGLLAVQPGLREHVAPRTGHAAAAERGGFPMTLPPVPGEAQPLADQLAVVLGRMPDPSGGPFAGQLEHDLAEVFGVPHVVAVASGTAALHAALSACGIRPGDEVLVPALTVIMTVAPLSALGAVPVFVDSDPDTLDLDYDDAARKVTSRTRAIIPVHLWGRMGDSAALAAFASEHGLTVVEDAAQAAGTARDGQRAGTVGTVGCFSMKDGKILWSGEGGFLLTARRELAEHATAFRSHCQPAPAGQAPLSRLATNSRLAAPLAAIALANLRRFSNLVELRRAQTRHLLDALEQAPGLLALPPATREEWNGFAPLLHIDLPNPRAFAEHLAQQGVPNSTGSFRLVPCDTRPMFTHRDQPCRGAAQILDHTLAVILTERDTQTTLDRYAAVIAREATTWAT